MATKNFFVHDGLKVRGNTLLNGTTYSSAASAKLHVKTAASTGANLTNVNGLIIENGGNSTNYAFKVATGCGNIFNIQNNGYVGLGTVSPNENLTVVGNISASGSLYGNIEDLTFDSITLTGDLNVGGTVFTDVLSAGTEIESPEFIGNLRGAVSFTAKAGEALTKGDAVYISGISGNTTVVAKADADDSSKMPAFGIANESVSLNSSVTIINFGAVTNLDTSSFPEGTELFVGTTAGQLVSAAPTGESAAIQKMAKVTRQDNAAGSITVMGAGRSNAVPNLNEGSLFVGNSANQAVADNTLFVDIANSRVGIGTTDPAAKLNIAGDVLVDTGYSLFTDAVDENRYNETTGAGGIAVNAYNFNGSSGGPNIQIANNYSSGWANIYTNKIDAGASVTNANNRHLSMYSDGVRAWDLTINSACDLAILNAQTGNLLLDPTGAGYVGIGKTNPTHSLDVASTSRIGGNLHIGTSSATPSFITLYGDGSSNHSIASRDDSWTAADDIRINTYGALYINLDSNNNNTSGADFMIGRHGGSSTISDWLFTLNGESGNVGIGTTSPNAKLEISGDTRSGGRILYGGTESNYLTGVSYASIYGTADTFESVSGLFGSLVLQSRSNTARPIIFVTGATPSEKMRLTSDGKVGIGTTDPGSLLHVSSTSSSYLTIQNTTNAGCAGLNLRDENGTDQFKLFYDLPYNASCAHINGNGLTLYSTQVSAEIAKFGLPTNYTAAYFKGCVGIGTTSPGGLLHLQSDGGNACGAYLLLKHANNNNTDIIGTIEFANNLGKTACIQAGTTGHCQSGYMSFSTELSGSASEVMRITEDSNVGIGKTNPGSRLSVDGVYGINVRPGTAGACGASTAINNLLSLTMPYGPSPESCSNAGARVGVVMRGSLTDPITGDGQKTAAIYGVSEDVLGYSRKMGMALYTSSFDANAAERVRIDADGNVGIGLTNPASLLTIADGTAPTLEFCRTGALGNGWIKSRDSDNNIEAGIQFYDSNIRFYNNGNQNVVINSSGCVGIGTTNPTAPLNVVGTNNVEGPTVPSVVQIADSSDATKNLRLGYEPTWDAGSIASSDLGAGWKSTVINARGGNVGIGVTDPSDAKLVVKTGSGYVGLTVGNLTGDTRLQISSTENSDVTFNVGDAAGMTTSRDLIIKTGNSERMRIKGEDVGIGTNSPGGRLEVALTPTTCSTTINETADFADKFVISNNAASPTFGDKLPLVFNVNGDGVDNISAAIVGERELAGWCSALSFWVNNTTSGPEGTDAIQERMRLCGSGQLRLHNYGSCTFSGTPTHYLTVDSSGNVIEELISSGTPTGSGTTGYVPKWTGSVALGNSIIYDSGTNIGIGTTDPADALSIQVPTSTTRGIFFQDQATNNYGTKLKYEEASNKFYIEQVENNVQTGILTIRRSDGNVGIGTTDPTQRLYVCGNTLATGYTYISDTNRYFSAGGAGVRLQTIHGYIQFGPQNSGFAHIETDRSTFYINKPLIVNGGLIESYDEDLTLNASYGGGAQNILFKSGGTTRMYMNSAGNFGIGTTNPTGLLHVCNGEFTLNSSASYTSHFNYQNAGTHYISMANSGYTYFRGSSNGCNPLTVSGGGKVGVNNTNPGKHLDVVGEVKIDTSADNAPALCVSRNAGVSSVSATGAILTNTAVYINGNEDTGSDALRIGSMNNSSGDYFIDASNYNATAAYNIILNPFVGSVGIGSTDPGGILDLRSSTANCMVFGYSGGTGAGHELQWDSSKVYINADPTAGYGNSGIRLSVDNQTIMTLTSNVGIGSVVPAYPFEVCRDTTGLISRIYNTNANGEGVLIRAGDAACKTRAFQVAATDDTKRFTINSDGTVGMGITNPTNPLEVQFEGDKGLMVRSTTCHSSLLLHACGTVTSGNYIRMHNYAKCYWINHQNNGCLVFRPDATGTVNNQIYFNQSSYVGIGTDPGHKLHVVDTGAVDIKVESTGANLATRLMLKTTTQDWRIGTHALQADNLWIYDGTAGAYRVAIDTSGNVGIGTTDPGATLDVLRGTATGGTAQFRGTTHVTHINYGTDERTYIRAGKTGAYVTINDAHNGDVHLVSGGGNVGIGTTNPTARLDVKSSIIVRDTNSDLTHAYLRSNSTEGVLLLNNGANWGFLARGSGNSPYIGAYSGGSLNIVGFTNSDASTFNSALTIFDFANSRVGIGTTSPNSLLHVHSTGTCATFTNIAHFRSGPDENATGSEIFIGHQGNSRGLIIQGGRGGEGAIADDNAVAHFCLNRSGGTIPSTTQDHIMTFRQGGFVGIGTTEPGTNTGKLFVGTPPSTGSSAIAQFGGFVRGNYFITHDSNYGIFPNTTCTGNVGKSDSVYNSAHIRYIVSYGDHRPSVDNCYTSGTATCRWSNVHTVCTTTGAIFESNLCTCDIGNCPKGSVVVWRDGKLQGTTQEYDYRVMGITAPDSDSPIVMGAEPILVTGDIEEGDPIVTSSIINHGMKGDRSCDLHGRVIGEALESGSGDSYTIMGMVRKF